MDNRRLSKAFGPKSDEVTDWRELRSEELHELYCSPNIIASMKSRKMRWAGHVARMGERRNAYRVLVGKPKGKRQLGRPTIRQEDNIKLVYKEMG